MDRNRKEGTWLEMDPKNYPLSWQLSVEAEKNVILGSIIYKMCASHLPFSVFFSFSKMCFTFLIKYKF